MFGALDLFGAIAIGGFFGLVWWGVQFMAIHCYSLLFVLVFKLVFKLVFIALREN